jgi:hypothetical protein
MTVNDSKENLCGMQTGICGPADMTKKAMKHLSSMPTSMALLALRRFAGCSNPDAVYDRSAYLQGIIR